MKSLIRRFPLFGFAALFALGASALSSARDMAPDDDEARYQAAMNRRAVEENCLICHSVEMIDTQRLTPAQWKTEVEKMVGWGAPVPKEQQPPLIEYLSTQYPADKPPAPLARMTYREALSQVAPERDTTAGGHADLGSKPYATHCANCHGAEAQGAELGPNLVEKPILEQRSRYNAIVQKGLHRMPGFRAALNEGDEAAILAWLKTMRYPAKHRP